MSYEFCFHADMYSERHRNDICSDGHYNRIAVSVVVEEKRKESAKIMFTLTLICFRLTVGILELNFG
jgi:hypothetical protein